MNKGKKSVDFLPNIPNLYANSHLKNKPKSRPSFRRQVVHPGPQRAQGEQAQSIPADCYIENAVMGFPLHALTRLSHSLLAQP